MRRYLSLVLALCLVASVSAFAFADSKDGDDTPESKQIIDRYVAASQARQDVPMAGSMEVDINASVPKLKKEGRLRALRQISKIGKITYKVLGFQGDNTVKREVIARYLEAEQQAQGNSEKYALIPQNYKFKYKGIRPSNTGGNVYVFQVAPRKKAVGLFKGEIWLDTQYYLPLMERGRLVKNPTIFFRKVEFVRDYTIQNGTVVLQHLESTIDTRIVGKVNISINYSNFVPPPPETPQEPGVPASQAAMTILSRN